GVRSEPNPRSLGGGRRNARARRVVGGRIEGLEVKTGELRARTDPELPENVAQVRSDRARAEEELRGDLAVAESLRDEVRDLQLLLGQLVPRVRHATTRRLAARAQLDARPFRPQFGPERLESAESGPQMLARHARLSCSAEELTEGQFGPRTVEGARRLGVHVERSLEKAFRLPICGEERAAV